MSEKLSKEDLKKLREQSQKEFYARLPEEANVGPVKPRSSLARLLRGVRRKPELDEVPRLSAEDFTRDSDFDDKNFVIKRKESLANIIRPYYGENLDREVREARRANYAVGRSTAKERIVDPMSYSRIYEDFPVEVQQLKYPNFDFESEISQVSTKEGAKIRKRNFDYFKSLLSSDDPETREEGERFFRVNSLDPDKGQNTQASVTQHELGHAVFRPESASGRGDLAYSLGNTPFYLSNEKFGLPLSEGGTSKTGLRHMQKPYEVLQAAGRFQREFFKETGDRVEPGEFTDLVLSKEKPDYLSQEGQRLLNYAQDSIERIDDIYEEEEAKKIKESFLDRLEAILPTVVEAENPSSNQRAV